MCARSLVADFTLSVSLRPDMKDGLFRAGELGSDSKWSSAIHLRARKKACGDIRVGTLILTTTDISANEADMLGARFGGCGVRSRPQGTTRTEVSVCSGAEEVTSRRDHFLLTARDLSRTLALNKVSWTACWGARPTHSGPQDKSELCVRRADRTSEHCDIIVHGSWERSDPFNIVREEGRPMFLKEGNSC